MYHHAKVPVPSDDRNEFLIRSTIPPISSVCMYLSVSISISLSFYDGRRFLVNKARRFTNEPTKRLTETALFQPSPPPPPHTYTANFVKRVSLVSCPFTNIKTSFTKSWNLCNNNNNHVIIHVKNIPFLLVLKNTTFQYRVSRSPPSQCQELK